MASPVPVQQVISTAKANGWASRDLATAVAIVMTENQSLDADAVGGPNKDGTHDYGLWQINEIHKPSQAQKFNFVENTKLARKIYVDAGKSFKPWATYKDGSYGANVPKAQAAMHEMAKVSGDKSLDPPYVSVDGQDDKLTKDALGQIDAKGASLIPDIPGAIAAAVASVQKMAGGMTTVVLAVVLLVLGVVILLRGSIVKTAAAATPVVIVGHQPLGKVLT